MMGPRKFVASNTADALKMVKIEMGPEAMVLSTKDTPDGVEIVAISPEDLSKMSQMNEKSEIEQAFEDRFALPTPKSNSQSASSNRDGNRPAPTQANRGQPDYQATASPSFIADSLQNGKRNSAKTFEDFIQPVTAPPRRRPLSDEKLPSSATAKTAQDSPSPRNVDQLLAEISEVKQLLRTQVAGNLWNTLQQDNQSHSEVVKHLLNVGFSSKLCAEIVKALPQEGDFNQLMKHAKNQVEGMFKTMDSFSIFDKGGVFAFIGPTGVGKTTTVAKIAARCVLRYGRNQVALLTTDTYRIGAQEQLKVFAKILGLPVVSLRDSDDLSSKLKELANRKVILLDTAGVSQRDILMIEQSQMLQEGSSSAFRILVMSSTTDLRTQEDVIHLHNQASKSKDSMGIGAAVITKTDEATQLAPVIDCLIRHNLPLLFLSNGQRVPEDLSQPDIAYLSHRAIHSRSYAQDLTMTNDQIPAVLSDHLNDWVKKVS